MRLIISSCDFGNPKSAKFIHDNLIVPIENCKVLYFPNEKATEKKIKSGMYESRLTAFGFKRENIYVFNYNTPAFFRNLELDVIYISGGNTFGTMKRICDADFKKDIVEYVKKGVVYIGGSAGAHIASADISHVQKYDCDTFGLNDFSGLGFYKGIFICHYNEEREKDFKQFSQTLPFRIVTLTNEESILITED